MQRFVIFICNVFYSFELGFLIPLLPGKIICIYNLFVFRLLRLLGGLSVLFYVTDYYLCFNCSIQICIIFLVTLHGFLMIILVLNSILFSVVLFREPIFEMYVFNFNYRIFKSVGFTFTVYNSDGKPDFYDSEKDSFCYIYIIDGE